MRETVMPAKKKKKVIGTKCGRVGERPGPSKASLQLNRSMQDDEYRGTRPGTKGKCPLTVEPIKESIREEIKEAIYIQAVLHG